MSTLLEMKQITKRFPGVLANDNVDLTLNEGQVLALVGENGAGKSTLIKMLSGSYTPDGGEIFVEGKQMTTFTPANSESMGVAVIHQELNSILQLSIAENIFVGNLPRKHGFIDYKTLYAESLRIQRIVGLGHLHPSLKALNMTVAERQLLELAKVVSKNAKIIVMDEPTATLNTAETEALFKIIKNLQAEGKGIIYISHKLDEIFAVCDTVMIMRDGKKVQETKVADITRDEIVTGMVGRHIEDMYPVHERPIGDVKLEVKGLRTKLLKDVSFSVRSGEILGLYGLIGSGSDEALRALFGADPYEAGEFFVDGEPVKITKPYEAMAAGLAYIPSERKSEGLFLQMDIAYNTSIVSLEKMSKKGVLNLKKEAEITTEWVKTLRTATPSIETKADSLSGGNQQKVVLAKWLNTDAKVILLHEPTRGIDVGAKVEIYNLMEKFCEDGYAVIMVSSDMPEVLSISDRVVTFYEGRITGEFTGSEINMDNLLRYAIGGEV